MVTLSCLSQHAGLLAQGTPAQATSSESLALCLLNVFISAFQHGRRHSNAVLILPRLSLAVSLYFIELVRTRNVPARVRAGAIQVLVTLVTVTMTTTTNDGPCNARHLLQLCDEVCFSSGVTRVLRLPTVKLLGALLAVFIRKNIQAESDSVPELKRGMGLLCILAKDDVPEVSALARELLRSVGHDVIAGGLVTS